MLSAGDEIRQQAARHAEAVRAPPAGCIARTGWRPPRTRSRAPALPARAACARVAARAWRPAGCQTAAAAGGFRCWEGAQPRLAPGHPCCRRARRHRLRRRPARAAHVVSDPGHRVQANLYRGATRARPVQRTTAQGTVGTADRQICSRMQQRARLSGRVGQAGMLPARVLRVRRVMTQRSAQAPCAAAAHHIHRHRASASLVDRGYIACKVCVLRCVATSESVLAVQRFPSLGMHPGLSAATLYANKFERLRVFR